MIDNAVCFRCTAPCQPAGIYRTAPNGARTDLGTCEACFAEYHRRRPALEPLTLDQLARSTAPVLERIRL